MGLTPYGNRLYMNLIFDHLVDVNRDGSFMLNLKYFKGFDKLNYVQTFRL